MVVDDGAILGMLADEEKSKYREAIVQSFIDCNESLKVCGGSAFVHLTFL